MEVISFNDFMRDTYKTKNNYISKEKVNDISALLVANLLCTESVNAANIDTAGIKILGICRNVGYWMCLIMASIEIIKSLMQGNTKGVSSIIVKYGLGYGSLFIMPWIFDLIKSLFS